MMEEFIMNKTVISLKKEMVFNIENRQVLYLNNLIFNKNIKYIKYRTYKMLKN